jgi:hypothetical protein
MPPSGDVDVDADVVAAHDSGVAGVHAGPQLRAIAVQDDRVRSVAHLVADGDGGRGVGEHGHETVAERLHHRPAISGDGLLADSGDRAEQAQHLLVAGAKGPAGEADEVGEHSRHLGPVTAKVPPCGERLPHVDRGDSELACRTGLVGSDLGDQPRDPARGAPGRRPVLEKRITTRRVAAQCLCCTHESGAAVRGTETCAESAQVTERYMMIAHRPSLAFA